MDFLHQWRHWIRPFIISLYFVLLIIALPLCVVELHQNGAKRHVEAWFTGGIFVMMAIPISLWGILQHLVNYTQPNLQRHIIRILWMVPIYAINAWFALRFKSASIYLDTLRECYEAYVIYNFMAYLLNYLWIEHPNLEVTLRNKEQVKHICPFCCFPPWQMKYSFIERCKHGALQYTIVRPVTTCIALICQLNGAYNEGDFDFKSAWSYLTIINNISQIWAMYCLVLFYKAMKEELAPIKPIPKFLCVKFVVFFSFWQSVLIAILVKLNWIPQGGAWVFYNNIQEVATGLQDFLICIEMFLAAIAHYFSFSHKPYIRSDNEDVNCFASFLMMWDVSDMRDDVIEHVKVIGKTVKKTISKPQIRNENERTPLLAGGDSRTNSRVDLMGSQSSADWDAASLENSERPFPPVTETTASMNNYMVLEDEESDQEVERTHTQTGNKHSQVRRYYESETNKTALPMLASSCPGWICYAEKTHGSYILPYISSTKSPQQIMGSLVKDYFAAKQGQTPDRIYHVTVMPCYDKKLEASRQDFYSDLYRTRDVDCVITTGEVEKMLEKENVTLGQVEGNTAYCVLSGFGSPDGGLGSHLGGGSGGYLEHVMRYAVSQIHGSSVDSLQYKTLRNQDFQEVTVEIEGKRPFKMALAYGFRNIQNIVQKIKRGKMTYDFVEIMACPSGCVNGGGQIRPMEGQTNNELLQRVKESYDSVPCVQPDLWPGVKDIYEEWLGGVDTEKARAMLHTQYHGVEKVASALNIQW